MNFMVMERRLFIFCFLAVVVWQSVALAAGTSSFTALTASLDEAIEAHRHYVAVREGRITPSQRFSFLQTFEDGLRGYTYFER